MRFSIREFRMVTDLKCSGDYQEPETDDQDYQWDMLNRGHALTDLEKHLRKTNENVADEGFSLEMLFLIESIVLQRYKIYKFPFENIKRAQDINVLMNYPWGRDAYKLLLKFVKSNLKNNVKNKDKYDIHGFPWALPVAEVAFGEGGHLTHMNFY
ncbi:unnamed protein product [Arabis nemorensis]|uniref:DUF1985 domain-containing protein n=1 Tax=Arabis nemorensis TaxID=586526 RepID=A0A565CW13_9BRAS|nr:unnamed protein product [Arabis nemorensis]